MRLISGCNACILRIDLRFASFSGNIGSGQAYPAVWNPSVYAQDTWQVANNVTLNNSGNLLRGMVNVVPG